MRSKTISVLLCLTLFSFFVGCETIPEEHKGAIIGAGIGAATGTAAGAIIGEGTVRPC